MRLKLLHALRDVKILLFWHFVARFLANFVIQKIY